MSGTPNSDDVVVIKKYANRRLYNTESSTYITLDNLAHMTREGRHFKVVDAKSGDDITHNVLTQIIMDEEARGANMLPVNFLRQLISMYGDSMQSLVPQYLESSMDAFRRNQEQFRSAMEGAFGTGPFAELARQNMAFFDAATTAFRAAGGTVGGVDAAPAAKADTTPQAGGKKDQDDLEALKAQIASLQNKIDKIDK